MVIVYLRNITGSPKAVVWVTGREVSFDNMHSMLLQIIDPEQDAYPPISTTAKSYSCDPHQKRLIVLVVARVSKHANLASIIT